MSKSISCVPYEGVASNLSVDSRTLPDKKVYTAVVPTYPGGMWSFTLGSKKYSEVDLSKLAADTKYVSPALLSQCFALPAFLQKALAE